MPGIALAGIAFWSSASGYWSGPGWLNEFLVVSLVINYLNLLPLMPLDGGRVLEVLVFARHPRVRFAFAALCCALLFALGAQLNDTVLRVVAVLIALGLPFQWWRMQVDQVVRRDTDAALDEPQALQLIFGALQQAKFQSWSFAKRSAAAAAMLPDLLARRASTAEAVVGVLIYVACLFGPIGAAVVAVPQVGAVLSLLTPAMRLMADDVEPEPAQASVAEPPDWNAKLAHVATLSADEQLAVHLGAAQQANDAEDTDTAGHQFQAAWALAQALPARDLRRIDVLQGLASVAQDEMERSKHLNHIVSELVQPVGPERERVAQAKEQLAYGDLPAPERVALLRDALDLRLGATPNPNFDLASTRLSLARALDAHTDSAGAQVQLQARLDGLQLPDAQDRSRQALNLRVQRVLATVDLAWFLIGHGHAAQAHLITLQALAEVPAKVTVSWLNPQQQALEVAVWSALLAQQTASLAPQWKAYDAARSTGFTGDRKLLAHELDRAVVAQALNDARMLAQARRGVEEAVSNMSTPPTRLCQPPPSNAQPNWRASQHSARQRVLAEMGHCRAT